MRKRGLGGCTASASSAAPSLKPGSKRPSTTSLPTAPLLISTTDVHGLLMSTTKTKWTGLQTLAGAANAEARARWVRGICLLGRESSRVSPGGTEDVDARGQEGGVYQVARPSNLHPLSPGSPVLFPPSSIRHPRCQGARGVVYQVSLARILYHQVALAGPSEWEKIACFSPLDGRRGVGAGGGGAIRCLHPLSVILHT